MVPGFVAGRYGARELEIDVRRLAERAGTRCVEARVVGGDTGGHAVILEERHPIPYDVASFDIGSTVAGLDAAGDCATLAEHPTTPKAGVYAVRQRPILAANLRGVMSGGKLARYTAQRDFLTSLHLGDGTALAAKWGLTACGRWVMALKDRIDRRFVARFA